jgi:hypothetical protein
MWLARNFQRPGEGACRPGCGRRPRRCNARRCHPRCHSRCSRSRADKPPSCRSNHRHRCSDRMRLRPPTLGRCLGRCRSAGHCRLCTHGRACHRWRHWWRRFRPDRCCWCRSTRCTWWTSSRLGIRPTHCSSPRRCSASRGRHGCHRCRHSTARHRAGNCRCCHSSQCSRSDRTRRPSSCIARPYKRPCRRLGTSGPASRTRRWTSPFDRCWSSRSSHCSWTRGTAVCSESTTPPSRRPPPLPHRPMPVAARSSFAARARGLASSHRACHAQDLEFAEGAGPGLRLSRHPIHGPVAERDSPVASSSYITSIFARAPRPRRSRRRPG